MPLPTTLDINPSSASNNFAGPFISSAGNVYVVAKHDTSALSVTVEKATDPTSSFVTASTWLPPGGAALESVWAVQVGDVLHIATQDTLDDVGYRQFNMANDSWLIDGEFVVGPANVNNGCSVVVRSDGTVILAYMNGESVMGTIYNRIEYAVRSTGGTWTVEQAVSGTGVQRYHQGPVAVLGSSDRVHFWWADTTSARLEHRSLSSANLLDDLINIEDIANVDKGYLVTHGVRVGSEGRVVFLDTDSKSTVVKYTSQAQPTHTTGRGTAALTTATVNSRAQQLLAVDGTDVYLIYSDETDRDIYTTVDKGSGFGADTVIWVGTGTVSYLLGANIYTRAGSKVLALVGADFGTWQYNEYPLPLPAPTNLSATTRTASKIFVDWDAVTGASGYTITWSGGTSINVTSGTSYEFTDLDPSTAYDFEVYAYDAGLNPGIPVTTSATTLEDNVWLPVADITREDWVTDTAATTNLYATLDEVAVSDADYIYSAVAPTSDVYEVQLEPITDPGISTGHTVNYRYGKDIAADEIDLTVQLRQGGPLLSLTTVNSAYAVGGPTSKRTAQTVTLGSGESFNAVGFSLYKNGSPSDNQLVEIFTDNAGQPGTLVASGSFSPSLISGTTTATANTVNVVLDGTVSGSGIYWITIRRSGSDDTSNYIAWRMNQSSTYSGGQFYYTPSATPTVYQAANPAGDAWLELGTVISQYQHTNISSTLASVSQDLTEAEADLITNYSDLRLRFTANTSVNTSVPTKVADRATTQAGTQFTTNTDLVLSGLTVGNYLIIRNAADNAGGGGAAVTATLSNQSGTAIDTATYLSYQNNYDPGSASLGVTANLFIAKITSASGTVRITFGDSIWHATVAEEWSGLLSDISTVVNGGGTGFVAGGTSGTPSVSTGGVGGGARNLIYMNLCTEGPPSDSYTEDSTNNTDGPWISLTRHGREGIDAPNSLTTAGAYKVMSVAGAHTWSPTITSRDWVIQGNRLNGGLATARAKITWANFEIVEVIEPNRPSAKVAGSYTQSAVMVKSGGVFTELQMSKKIDNAWTEV